MRSAAALLLLTVHSTLTPLPLAAACSLSLLSSHPLMPLDFPSPAQPISMGPHYLYASVHSSVTYAAATPDSCWVVAVVAGQLAVGGRPADAAAHTTRNFLHDFRESIAACHQTAQLRAEPIVESAPKGEIEWSDLALRGGRRKIGANRRLFTQLNLFSFPL